MTNEQRACSDCGKLLTQKEIRHLEKYCGECERKNDAITTGDKRALELCIEWSDLCDKLDNEQDDCMREYYYGLKTELMDKIYNLGLEAQKAGE